MNLVLIEKQTMTHLKVTRSPKDVVVKRGDKVGADVPLTAELVEEYRAHPESFEVPDEVA